MSHYMINPPELPVNEEAQNDACIASTGVQHQCTDIEILQLDPKFFHNPHIQSASENF